MTDPAPLFRQSANNRDSLAKLIYSELFAWVREGINKELSSNAGFNEDKQSKSIGLLDIFGFESFSVFDKKAKFWRTANGLEQLCINFANENLQVLFNKKVLEADKLLYQAEFEPGDVPDIQIDGRGAASLASIDLVFAK